MYYHVWNHGEGKRDGARSNMEHSNEQSNMPSKKPWASTQLNSSVNLGGERFKAILHSGSEVQAFLAFVWIAEGISLGI
jgi:hypothetical protein